ncbi:uncharacterized protein RCC_10339 [Ramularia collo-cygni]|uniref:EKC/KEOPS complex subunit GON7 n=1 Tax=Ramularia collo-cygni TaxID=112498 RepID=A0A2D3VNT0_9PEZI|nr:uncharacterized protein RCC_10339 [Ramularia collo-cygni]CZT24614.1 uncharacterized protein RCC_10339 [Ramularia collo-cygni]
MTQSQLTATYTSPSTTKSFTSSSLLPPSSETVEEKTTYLGALRANISTLQGEINAFLTQKMEEDKVAEGSGDYSKVSSAAAAAADEREEDFYGEEDFEKDG